MKKEATKNTIKRNYSNIINVGYTNLENLLYLDDAKYYNHGVYGWNWDAYELDENTCLITGYRNTLGDNIDREYTQIIDNKAREILNNSDDYDDEKQQLDELKQELLKHYKDYICG